MASIDAVVGGRALLRMRRLVLMLVLQGLDERGLGLHAGSKNLGQVSPSPRERCAIEAIRDVAVGSTTLLS